MISLAIIVLLGGFIVSTKVNAQQPAPPKGAGGGGAAAPAKSGAAAAQSANPAPKGSGAAVAPKGAPDAGKPPAKDAGADAKKDDDAKDDDKKSAGKDDDKKPSPLDDSVIQSDDDFPKDLSEEEKAAIGTGKVPIHKDGQYRSAFANPKFGDPAKVKVGLVISEIRDYSLQQGDFEADFFLSLTADKPMPPITPAFTNGHEVDCKATADVPTFKFYRCSGKFTSQVDLRKYPFDTQYLKIQIEDAVYGVDTLVFEADQNRTSLDEGFRFSSYAIGSVGGRTYKHLYPPRFDRDDLYVSRYEFALGIDRFATSAAFSVFVPAFIIVIISLFGLWVPPDELEVRSNAGAPMLAAAVLFHYSLIQALPATAYLTRADKLMLGVYVSLLINMASTWFFLLVHEESVEKVFKIARAWVPPLTALVMALATVL